MVVINADKLLDAENVLQRYLFFYYIRYNNIADIVYVVCPSTIS